MERESIEGEEGKEDEGGEGEGGGGRELKNSPLTFFIVAGTKLGQGPIDDFAKGLTGNASITDLYLPSICSSPPLLLPSSSLYLPAIVFYFSTIYLFVFRK